MSDPIQPNGSQPEQVIGSDLNGAGGPDIVVANAGSSFVSVFMNCAKFAPLLGDVNMDGFVNLLDVQPFIDLLANGEYQAEADTNQDGSLDLLDVQPFIDLLAG